MVSACVFRRIWLGLILTAMAVGLLACAKSSPNSSGGAVGLSAAELQQQKGSPVSTETPTARTQAKVLTYPHDERYQVEDNKVVAAARPPSGDERVLQTWLQKWVNVPTVY